MDNLTKEQRHKNMSRIRGKNTKIEITLRKALWARGYRYRICFDKLPGKPDIVLTKYRIAIFCDSEFFHGKDWDNQKARLKTNKEYWIKKIEYNINRDREIDRQLAFLEWTVIRFWGRDITKNLDVCIQTIEEYIFQQKLNSYRLEI